MSDTATSTARTRVSSSSRVEKARRRPRGRGLRTTHGCLVCKQRHVKCDEARPGCGNCHRNGRDCIYVDASASAESGFNDKDGDGVMPADVLGPPRESSLVCDSSASTPSSLGRHIGPGGIEDSALEPHANSCSTVNRTEHDPALSTFPLPRAISVANDRPASLLCHSSPSQLCTPESDAVLRAPELDGVSHVQTPTSFHGMNPGQAEECLVTPLGDLETSLFRYYVEHLSTWIDLMDSQQHFTIHVPQMAIRNQGLLKAILALSARVLSLRSLDGSTTFGWLDRTVHLQYYHEALHFLQQAMKVKTYLSSDILLATVLVTSTYEMMDEREPEWKGHLEGVFHLQRSQYIHGESGGIRQAIWWAWLRQDLWAAFRERRKIFSFFKLTKQYADMDFWDMANRAVYLLAQCINFVSIEETEDGQQDIQMRMTRAHELQHAIDEWKARQSLPFHPLPTAPAANDTSLCPLWINPPALSAAVQMHHFARILLLAHMPAAGGLEELDQRRKLLEHAVDEIVRIALRTTNDAAMLISTQCLYVAAKYSQKPFRRIFIADLVRLHQKQTGWPVKDLTADFENGE